MVWVWFVSKPWQICPFILKTVCMDSQWVVRWGFKEHPLIAKPTCYCYGTQSFVACSQMTQQICKHRLTNARKYNQNLSAQINVLSWQILTTSNVSVMIPRWLQSQICSGSSRSQTPLIGSLAIIVSNVCGIVWKPQEFKYSICRGVIVVIPQCRGELEIYILSPSCWIIWKIVGKK